MVEFVHEQGSSRVKDEESRRRVRSQAMRDFRRRQREERETARIDKKRLSTQRDDRSASPTASRRPQSERTRSNASSESRSTQISSRRASERELSLPLWPLSSSSVTEQASEAVSMEPTQANITFDDLERLQDLELWDFESYALDNDSEDLSSHWPVDASTLAPSSTAWQEPRVETDEPFESQAQIEQMLGFCRSYLHWLCPGVETTTASKLLGAAWDRKQSSMLLAAFCLASVGHLDAVQPDRPSGNYQAYKTRVLQYISKQMADRESATSDETIGALACLLSFEMSKCTDEPMKHLRGLRSLLSQRRDVPVMVKALDLVHAVLFDNSPVLTEQLEHTSSTTGQTSQLEQILLTELENLNQNEQPQHTSPPHSLSTLLTQSSSYIQNLARGTIDTTTLLSLQNAINAFGTNNFPTTPDAIHLHKCCYSAICILFNSIASRHPLRHPSNQPHMRGLYDAMKWMGFHSWQDLPYLRLYILLIAGAATLDDQIKSFVKAELVRSIYHMGDAEWRRIETFMLRFLARRGIFLGGR